MCYALCPFWWGQHLLCLTLLLVSPSIVIVLSWSLLLFLCAIKGSLIFPQIPLTCSSIGDVIMLVQSLTFSPQPSWFCPIKKWRTKVRRSQYIRDYKQGKNNRTSLLYNRKILRTNRAVEKWRIEISIMRGLKVELSLTIIYRLGC